MKLTQQEQAKDAWALLMHNYAALAEKDKGALNFMFEQLKGVIESK